MSGPQAIRSSVEITPAGKTGAGIADAPAFCADSEPKRDRTCVQNTLTYTIFVLPSGRIIGTGLIDASQWEVLNPKSRSWTEHIELLLHDATGVVASRETEGVIRMDCEKCKAVGGQKFVFTEGVPERQEFTITSPGKNTDRTVQNADLALLNAAAPFSPAATDLPKLVARCDTESVFGNNWPGGCVNPRAVPTFEISLKGNAPEVAAHILFAQANLKQAWGLKNDGPPLTRSTDSSLNERNRQIACPKSRKRPPGKSCDEYPFASTHEGAASNSDFDWDWVDATQNSLAGTDLGEFYKKNRMLDGDEFWVSVT